MQVSGSFHNHAMPGLEVSDSYSIRERIEFPLVSQPVRYDEKKDIENLWLPTPGVIFAPLSIWKAFILSKCDALLTI